MILLEKEQVREPPHTDEQEQCQWWRVSAKVVKTLCSERLVVIRIGLSAKVKWSFFV